MRKPKVYMASRIKHAEEWRKVHAAGQIEIVSTWINEENPVPEEGLPELMTRCIHEVQEADYLVLYTQPNEHLKCALIEAGAAMFAGIPVFVVGNGPSISPTMLAHPNVEQFCYLHHAFAELIGRHCKKQAEICAQ